MLVGGPHISFTICMESRFTKVCGERWVCQPSCGGVDLGSFYFKGFFFGSQRSFLLLLGLLVDILVVNLDSPSLLELFVRNLLTFFTEIWSTSSSCMRCLKGILNISIIHGWLLFSSIDIKLYLSCLLSVLLSILNKVIHHGLWLLFSLNLLSISVRRLCELPELISIHSLPLGWTSLHLNGSHLIKSLLFGLADLIIVWCFPNHSFLYVFA